MTALDDSPEVRTVRLVLRPLREDDAAQVYLLFGQWEVIRMLTTPPWPYRGTLSRLESPLNHTNQCAAQCEREGDRTVLFSTSPQSAKLLRICRAVATDGLVIANHNRINTFALAARLPTSHGIIRELIDPGGLMSYGPNNFDLYRRAAEIVDKILRGAKPADIPVEQPTKFDLAVNLTTAKALGLTLPELLLVRADELIE